MAILITGAGLIGAQVARVLADREERVVLYDMAPQRVSLADIVPLERVTLAAGDILDLPGLLHLIRRERVDRIVHTAGLLVAAVASNPYAGVRVNVQGTATVLEAARLEGIARVVFASSGTIYIPSYSAFSVPMTEDFPLRVLSERPTLAYAATKLFCEWLGLGYHDTFGVDFVALRFDSVFGPWRGTLGGRFSALMQRLLWAAIHRRPVAVDPSVTWSGGDQFIYSKDAAHAAVLALFADGSRLRQRVYNVGMGKLYTFQEIVDVVRRQYPGTEIRIEGMVETGLGGAPLRPTAYDLTTAQEELGFSPRFDMERAVADYGAWLQQSTDHG